MKRSALITIKKTNMIFSYLIVKSLCLVEVDGKAAATFIFSGHRSILYDFLIFMVFNYLREFVLRCVDPKPAQLFNDLFGTSLILNWRLSKINPSWIRSWETRPHLHLQWPHLYLLRVLNFYVLCLREFFKRFSNRNYAQVW